MKQKIYYIKLSDRKDTSHIGTGGITEIDKLLEVVKSYAEQMAWPSACKITIILLSPKPEERRQ